MAELKLRTQPRQKSEAEDRCRRTDDDAATPLALPEDRHGRNVVLRVYGSSSVALLKEVDAH
jgi:hypothetical protein